MLLVGVSSAKHGGSQGNKKPMITRESELRICADLCSSGLGGESCGAFCLDISPKSLPKQLTKDYHNVKNNKTREDACPVLCENGLGYPFCKCTDNKLLTKQQPINNKKKTKTINFQQICDYYCKEQRWWLRGCPTCELTLQYGGNEALQNGGYRLISVGNYVQSTDVDWNKWCDVQCANSNGGSACNCDLLPFSLI